MQLGSDVEPLDGDWLSSGLSYEGSSINVGELVTVAWDDAQGEYRAALFDPLTAPEGRDDEGPDPPTDDRDRAPKGRGR